MINIVEIDLMKVAFKMSLSIYVTHVCRPKYKCNCIKLTKVSTDVSAHNPIAWTLQTIHMKVKHFIHRTLRTAKCCLLILTGT